ncbi:hypothetical protein NPS70_27120 [Streptomyces sp. C10-9-1]|uniref:hypothetical protein n=1 Tax=Streptomyces sp. C10-9-1 TaxID=1859285 RepID=UPI0021110DCA|nr:hypothetical protein [Streptomyces sp. C10-9-1]MCQ6556831.1 hypothetical protein [Streptomyces sp. C10-9-1]
MDPVFQMFPQDGPLRLANRATSGLVPFLVPSDASTMFLRLIAVGSNCESLGGAAPTIELRAGTGEMSDIPRAPGEGAIHDEYGAHVGTASWTRERHDIFMVELFIANKDARLWRVRITNNDPEELGFVWVTSDVADDTHQPRPSMQRHFERHEVAGIQLDNIVANIANVGTAELKFKDLPGTDMGAGFTLLKVPSGIPPNGCGSLEIRVDTIVGTPFSGLSRDEATYVLKCNVVDAEDTTLTLVRSEKTRKWKEKDKEKDKEKEKEDKDAPHELMKAGDTLARGRDRHPGGVGDDAGERLANLERTVSDLIHFIRPELRPDLSTSALTYESQTGQQAKQSKQSER